MIYTELIPGIYAHGSRQIRYVSGDRDLCPRFGRGRDVGRDEIVEALFTLRARARAASRRAAPRCIALEIARCRKCTRERVRKVKTETTRENRKWRASKRLNGALRLFNGEKNGPQTNKRDVPRARADHSAALVEM